MQAYIYLRASWPRAWEKFIIVWENVVRWRDGATERRSTDDKMA